MNSTSVEHGLEQYIAKCLLVEAARRTGGSFQNIDLVHKHPLQNGHHGHVEIPEEEEEPTKYPRLRRFKRAVRRFFSYFPTDLGLLIVLLGYAALGAWIFKTIEGPYEEKMEIELDEAKRLYVKDILNLTGKEEELERFIECELYLLNQSSTDQWNDTLFLPPTVKNISESELNSTEAEPWPTWKHCGEFARDLGALVETYFDQMKETKLYGQLNKGAMTWDYYGGLFYCATIFTTVGYGNIVPITKWGRIATMIYALIGIPLCLVFLGKLGGTLTRCIKFFWGYGRRFYYTGHFARIRRMIPQSKVTLNFVQRIKNRIRIKNRRKSSMMTDDMIIVAAQVEDMVVPTFEIDENFNLPPLFAISLGFLYIFLGAFMYKRWEENWDWLVAFYFTFISLSTVGFGDVTPEHPNFFLLTFLYLLVGFALIAMIINVVMESVAETIQVAGEQLITLGQNIIPMDSEPSTPPILSSSEQLAEAKKASELRRNSM